MTHIPLADQIVQIEKMLRDDARRFQLKVDKGNWKQETADRKLAALRAVQSTLTWLERNYDWIKPEGERRLNEARAKAEFDAELAALDDEPIVAAIHDAFPDAEVTAIRPLEPEDEATDRAAQRTGERLRPGASAAPAQGPSEARISP